MADESPIARSTAAPADEAWTLLRTLFGQQRRRFLIAASELDLHPAQAGALLQLATPLPMNELASLLACDNSNVTGLIDRLEARGPGDATAELQRPPRQARRAHRRGPELRERMLDRVGQPDAGIRAADAGEHRRAIRSLCCLFFVG